MNRPAFRKPRQSALPRNIYRRAVPGLGTMSNRFSGQDGALACVNKARCGLCAYVNLDYKTSLQGKFELGLQVLKDAGVLGSARVLPPVPSPRPLEYRSLFKLAVRPAPPPAPARPVPRSRGPGRFEPAPPPPVEGAVAPRFQLGLFAPGSHDLLSMDACPLHTPPLQRLLLDLQTELDKSPLTPYDEATHTGQVRYIAARAAHLTGEIMLTFVVTEPLKVELRRLVASLQRLDHKINSAYLNLNTERGNAIFGTDSQRLAGAEKLRERVCDLDFEISPTSFFQINPWQAINLYRRIEGIVGEATAGTPVAWDLYCGTGQISLILARLGYRVLGIEENAEAVRDAEANARKNHLEGRTTFLAARVEDAEPLLPPGSHNPVLIVANPSRRGLAEATRRHLAMLLSSHPQARFLYVSCDVETLARDLAALAELTSFKVRQIEPFDMFPQTTHMEWLAVLSHV